MWVLEAHLNISSGQEYILATQFTPACDAVFASDTCKTTPTDNTIRSDKMPTNTIARDLVIDIDSRSNRCQVCVASVIDSRVNAAKHVHSFLDGYVGLIEVLHIKGSCEDLVRPILGDEVVESGWAASSCDGNIASEP
ncbi:hypothetical protein ACKLNR_015136 [Fusarium oxysporum f. sp. zingiberi]